MNPISLTLSIFLCIFSCFKVMAEGVNSAPPPLPSNVDQSKPVTAPPTAPANESKPIPLEKKNDNFIDLGGATLPSVDSPELNSEQKIQFIDQSLPAPEPEKEALPPSNVDGETKPKLPNQVGNPEQVTNPAPEAAPALKTEENPQASIEGSTQQVPDDTQNNQKNTLDSPPPSSPNIPSMSPANSANEAPYTLPSAGNENNGGKGNIKNINDVINNLPKTDSRATYPKKQEPLKQTTAPVSTEEVEKKKKQMVTKAKENKDTQKALTEEQLKFAEDEAKVLLLPNDDVILGKLTEDAKIALMDINDYIKLYETFQEQARTEADRNAIINFVKTYPGEFGKIKRGTICNTTKLYKEAIAAIMHNDLTSLKSLLDNYGYMINFTTNRTGSSLLDYAILNDNYEIAKFLIMRGADLNMHNYYSQAALGLSARLGREELFYLLVRAGAK